MQDELRKLAQLLRNRAAVYDQRKLIKCAQIIRGAVALGLLQKKIGSR